MEFTEQQLDNWRDYEVVRKGGRWNMFFPQARRATGLTSEEYSFVMRNFSELKVAVIAADNTVKEQPQKQ